MIGDQMRTILSVVILFGCGVFASPALAQTSGNTPPPPPVCGSTNAGALYTNTGTSPATVYTCSYYNLAWQWVVNPSYGGLVSYPTVPSTCSGSLPVFVAGWPNTQEYVCVNGVPDAIGGAGSGVTTFAAPSASWPSWLVPTVTNPTTTPSLTVVAGTIPPSAGGTGATTAAGAALNIMGVTQTGTLGTSSQVSTFPGTVAVGTSLQVGAGTAVTGNQGTGLLVQHSAGAATSGNCVQFDASGNTVDAGSPCVSTTLP